MSTSSAQTLPAIRAYPRSAAPAVGRQARLSVTKVPVITNAHAVGVAEYTLLRSAKGNLFVLGHRASSSNLSIGFSTTVAADRHDSAVHAAGQTFGRISKIHP